MAKSSSERLIEAGFLSGAGKSALADKETGKTLKGEALTKKLEELKKEGKEADIQKYADHHLLEVSNDQLMVSDYPTPISHYHLIYESYKKPLEAYYFWSLNHLNDLGFGQVIKITDIFAASEQSALYGSSAQRLGLAQDKVSGYLVAIGRLVKELFQIVREVRIIDERLNYHLLLQDKDPRVRDSAEVALKSIWVELVEGGGKNTNSVFGLQRELNYKTLPALFFKYHPQEYKDVGKLLDAIKENLNQDNRVVLEKKLIQYLNWRKENKKELDNRRDHTLKYLNQHYQAIQMYLGWVRPYLKHISRLSQKSQFLDSADLVTSFEGSMMEIEILGTQVVKGAGDNRACMLLNFKYRTSPTMSFQGQDYKQGPIHMGKVEIVWRSYVWTDDQIKSFVQCKQMEDFDMLGNIDQSIRDAMEGLGDSLRRYIAEAQGKKFSPEKEEKKEEKPKKPKEFPSLFDPIKSTVKGFKEVFAPIKPTIKDIRQSLQLQSSKEWEESNKKAGESGAAKGTAKGLCWTHYKNFKKKHGFVTW